jgi:hypothetical protein
MAKKRFRSAFAPAAAIICACAALASTTSRPARAELASGAAADDREAAHARATAQSALAAMESSSSHVRLVLRHARASHDPKSIACADLALTRADVALRIARDHADRALAAWSQGDREHARFEMARLGAGGEMSRAAAKDADACAAGAPDAAASSRAPGEVVAPNDVTVVRVTVDPMLPRDVAGYPGDPR